MAISLLLMHVTLIPGRWIRAWNKEMVINILNVYKDLAK
ncbi:hypothetical protein Asal01_00070 [Fodinibius salicampi]